MQNKKPSVVLNYFMNTLLTMSSFIFPFITFPYVSRVLGVEGNGKVQLAISFIYYFTMFAQLGIPTYGIKACAAVRENRKELSKTVHELLIINIMMTAIAYVAFFVALAAVPRLRDERLLYIISSASIFLTTIGIEWLFRALEQYTYITIRSLIFKVVGIVAMFALVHTKEDYVIYAAISVLASAGSALLNLTQLPRYIDIKPVGDYHVWKHIKPVVVLFAYSCATTIYINLDSVMLGFMRTEVDVGYYAVAVKLKNILVSIVTALGAVLLPRVSFYYNQGQMKDFWETIKKSLHVIVLIAAPFTLYCMLMAGPAIRFLAGDGYALSVMPMVWIMPTLLFIGMTYVMGIEVLIPMGKETLVLIASAAAAVADVIINALLIPSLGATGAAIGTLVAEALVFIIQYIMLRKQILPVFMSIKWILPCIALGAASIITVPLMNVQLPDFWLLAVTSVAFFGVYGLTLLAVKDPMTILLWNKIRNIGLKLLKKDTNNI